MAGSSRRSQTSTALVALWAITGHWFDYSENWQLVVNTGTTIVTFLMVFVIQNSQTRESRELHLKLDELLRAVEAARTGVIRSDGLTDEELDRLHSELVAVASRAGEAIEDDHARPRRRNAAMILRHWLKRPPKRRTAAHLPEFYPILQTKHPQLVDFPESCDDVRVLEKVLHGHLSRRPIAGTTFAL